MTKKTLDISAVLEIAKQPILKMLEDRVIEPIIVDEFFDVIKDIDSSVEVSFSNAIVGGHPTRKLSLSKGEDDSKETTLIVNTSARWNELQHNIQMDITNDFELILNLLDVRKTTRAIYAFGSTEEYEYASFKKTSKNIVTAQTKKVSTQQDTEDEVKIEEIVIDKFDWTVDSIIEYLQLVPAKSGKCYFNTKDMPRVVKLMKEEKPSKAEFLRVFGRGGISMGNLTPDNPDFMWLDFMSKEFPGKVYGLGTTEKFNESAIDNWKSLFNEFQESYK